ncbi:TIGR03087 family PEP-CTERM/XrtA system glycosyltransferase [Altererythrobacter sp. TH136]|uniref:TIGR03087 family PEP-CTERM/XrtA system glycosyltransferase n=1 Tax=Altererythrobacter sp. TH136 TaxID=2067415 RepID=UPI001163A4FE|nr:TIGR03087 family PEP-CTERM/XrtA system glycosyltransferase [Altererythrobacter sp. TH136]QDM40011.1 TIGR03087 family PEP-CTERM/XrtA system glycosyltransferase [Altererythrobacter sp. TH136]
MGETLFIAHRMPFPPDRGDKIRSHHLLKAVAELGPVHVATLGESAADFAAEPLLAEVCASYCLQRRPKLIPAGLRALASGKPVSLTAFASDPLRQWIEDTLEQRAIDTIFVFSGQMGQYVPRSFEGRLVVDLCDVDSAKFEAYAHQRTGPRAWIDEREGRLLAVEERQLANRADTVLLISDAEAALFRSRTGHVNADVVALGNGIDTDLFDHQATKPEAALMQDRGPHLLFTGQMDYLPNVDAVRRAAMQLMPAIRATYPSATFHIVGRAPSAKVRSLDGLNGTRVWGEVHDVRPFLAACSLVLAPLAIARGVQNKVLEAMAMARPVVLSPEAATGINATDGEHMAVGSDDAALIERVIGLLANTISAQAMGAAARKFVVQEKSWPTALAPLAGIMGRAAQRDRHAA